MSIMTELRLADIAVSGLPPAEAEQWIVRAAREQRPADIHLVNAYNIVLASEDVTYAAVLQDSTMNLPDGKSLSMAGALLASPVDQVRGPSLFAQMLSDQSNHGLSHFLLGGSESTLRLLEDAVSTRFPAARVAGAYSPPFKPISPEEIERQAAMIRESGADIVWLGLGTPKQDYLAAELAPMIDRPVVCVGAAFDFIAGTRPEAPPVLSRIGLEWLFRFAVEPRRLWRRYLLGNPKFIRLVMSEHRAARRRK